MIENFLTTEQVAKILQVHPFTILKFLKAGKLRGVKLGRVYRIKESDVHEFLESRMTRGAKVQEIHELPPLAPQTHTELPHVTHDTPAQPPQKYSPDPNPYILKKDETGEDGPPHYII